MRPYLPLELAAAGPARARPPGWAEAAPRPRSAWRAAPAQIPHTGLPFLMAQEEGFPGLLGSDPLGQLIVAFDVARRLDLGRHDRLSRPWNEWKPFAAQRAVDERLLLVSRQPEHL